MKAIDRTYHAYSLESAEDEFRFKAIADCLTATSDYSMPR